ncbi:hypothetical protein SGLAM104S_06935 [Streptomyces glaucescens]
MVQEILVRCAEANRLLDEKAEDFDRLRAFERNAPQALAAAQAAFDTASGRVVGAQTTLAAMRERYASSAIAPVPGDVEQAGSVAVRADSLQQARQAVEGNDNGAAAIQVRAAEAAVAQANRLIEAVDRRAQELENAAGALSSALTEVQSEREAAAAEPTITSSTAVVDKLKTGLDQMQLKLQELHGKRDQLVARAKSAEAQNRMLDAVKSIDVLDPTSELSRFEETVRGEEARAMGKEELAASSLDAQFEQLEGLGDATEIETRLAALKAA